MAASRNSNGVIVHLPLSLGSASFCLIFRQSSLVPDKHPEIAPQLPPREPYSNHTRCPRGHSAWLTVCHMVIQKLLAVALNDTV
jgi:hypothetical protein